MKWTTKKFIDYATCLTRDYHIAIQIKKIPNIFNFIDPKSFELPEISGVSRDVETNNFLRMAQN